MNATLARRATALLGALVAGSALTLVPASAEPDGLSAVRSATAGYHDVARAQADGFGELRDTAGVACIDQPGVGGMGIHYVNVDRVGDPAVTARAPELVLYERQQNGRLRLVAVEWVVLQSDWHAAGHAAAPSLFGEEFSLVPAGNRYGLPPFYELHAWVWQHNPTGTFQDYNPTVTCHP